MSNPHIPTATYRLQFNRNFTFRDAAAIVPYLSALGISHCYVSPYLRARPGSMHGYDIIDHNSINPEIGSCDDYENFVTELHHHGMGQILDIVPNHMGVMGSDNAWWLDVLENGEASDYTDFFDIDWNPIKDELQGKVLIPILAEQYGNALEKGELKLNFDAERGEFNLHYHEHRFPVDPKEYPRILNLQLEQLKSRLAPSSDEFLELQSITTAFSHLPGRYGLTDEQRAERNREKEIQKRRLASLSSRSHEIKEFITSNIETFNGKLGDPRSFDSLHELIKSQAYRLAQWRVAADDINYRRFFDINDLAALRMENEAVFTKTHRFILELVAQGKVNGIRIDHPDGLYDPAGYLCRLQSNLSTTDNERPNEDTHPAHNALPKRNAPPYHIYLVAEKILTGKERLRKDWPIDGTTGYEFSSLVNGLFVDQTAADKMERIYRSFCGPLPSFSDLVYTCKKLILKVGLASELNVLANLLSRIALDDRHTCDFTLNSLRSALAEIIANFPVYRTYVNGREVSAEDRRYVEQAISAARGRSDAPDLSVFDFIRSILLIETVDADSSARKGAIIRFAMKFQQVSAAVMAKSVEDTAFYRYNRLVSLNEVGSNPNQFGTSVEEFHRANQERLSCWPNSMLSSSTHDSKRSEDVRARINVLSEIPAEWRLRLRRWRNWNRSKKRIIEGEPAPTRNDEYLLYQTLLGAWPTGSLDDAGWRDFSDRVEQYVLKAVREAKEHTSWANANPEYEGALSKFTHTILQRSRKNPFLADFADFQRRVERIAIYNSLSQCLLKLTSPGIPDIYQGMELFQFNLVDPDNRRPIDFNHRHLLFHELQSANQSPEEFRKHLHQLVSDLDGDKAKLYLTWKTLCLRKSNAALFREGKYTPLSIIGPQSDHVVAFTRQHEGQIAIIAVLRLCAALLSDTDSTFSDDAVWSDTRLEMAPIQAPCFCNIFTGECMQLNPTQPLSFPVAHLFRYFPAAVLLSDVSTHDSPMS